MHIVPVIDLMAGRVVIAREGRRESYAPASSQLTERSDPRSVIDGLLRLHSFSTVYVADLDALTGHGSQRAILEMLAEHYDPLTLWVDQGLGALAGSLPANVVPVIGTESLDEASADGLRTLGRDFILSLDFLGDRVLGLESLTRDATLWPDRIIVMSLSHVGMAKGPDFIRLRHFRQHFPDKRIIAAGGVRGSKDLKALDAMGIDAVLSATAIHTGALEGATLRELAH